MVLFVTAVVLITLAVCVVGYVTTKSEVTALSFPQWLLSRHGLVTAFAVVMLIGAGSLIRWLDLAGGGERIHAIQPGLLARLRSRLRDTTTAKNTYFDNHKPPVTAAGFASVGLQAINDPFSKSPQVESTSYSQLAGTVSNSAEQYAQGLLKQLPATFRSLLYSRSGAIQLCYALLTYHLDPEERSARLSLFEFGLASFLHRHLSTRAARVTPARYRSYQRVGESLHLLFSLTARASSTSPEHARQLYCEAMAGFIDGKAEEVPESGKVSVRDLRDALSQLNQLSPLLKPAIIDACGHCVVSDQQVSPREYDILRLVADQLDCPMPPLAQAG